MLTAASSTVELATSTAAKLATTASVEVAASLAMEFTASESAEVAVSSVPEVVSIKSASVKAAAIITATIVTIPATAIEPMEPWPRADENSAHKIIRAVISVGRAGVRIIAVVAVGAYRRWASVNRSTNSNADSNLRVGGTCRQHENPKQDHVL